MSQFFSHILLCRCVVESLAAGGLQLGGCGCRWVAAMVYITCKSLLCYLHVGCGKFRIKSVHLFYDKALT